MKFEMAGESALPEIVSIMKDAKAQLRALGVDQWQYGSPNEAMWAEDIRLGRAVIALEDGKVAGAFAYVTGEDPSYRKIEGAWLTDGTAYATLHRVCVAQGMKGRGVAGALFGEAARLARAAGLRSLRIDTHPGNLPMQRAIGKFGFQKCGLIHLVGGAEDGHLRIAYEKPLDGAEA